MNQPNLEWICFFCLSKMSADRTHCDICGSKTPWYCEVNNCNARNPYENDKCLKCNVDRDVTYRSENPINEVGIVGNARSNQILERSKIEKLVYVCEEMNICTKALTGWQRLSQDTFYCNDDNCSESDRYICKACSVNCHEGHYPTNVEKQLFQCECDYSVCNANFERMVGWYTFEEKPILNTVPPNDIVGHFVHLVFRNVKDPEHEPDGQVSHISNVSEPLTAVSPQTGRNDCSTLAVFRDANTQRSQTNKCKEAKKKKIVGLGRSQVGIFRIKGEVDEETSNFVFSLDYIEQKSRFEFDGETSSDLTMKGVFRNDLGKNGKFVFWKREYADQFVSSNLLSRLVNVGENSQSRPLVTVIRAESSRDDSEISPLINMDVFTIERNAANQRPASPITSPRAPSRPHVHVAASEGQTRNNRNSLSITRRIGANPASQTTGQTRTMMLGPFDLPSRLNPESLISQLESLMGQSVQSQNILRLPSQGASFPLYPLGESDESSAGHEQLFSTTSSYQKKAVDAKEPKPTKTFEKVQQLDVVLQILNYLYQLDSLEPEVVAELRKKDFLHFITRKLGKNIAFMLKHHAFYIGLLDLCVELARFPEIKCVFFETETRSNSTLIFILRKLQRSAKLSLSKMNELDSFRDTEDYVKEYSLRHIIRSVDTIERLFLKEHMLTRRFKTRTAEDKATLLRNLLQSLVTIKVDTLRECKPSKFVGDKREEANTSNGDVSQSGATEEREPESDLRSLKRRYSEEMGMMFVKRVKFENHFFDYVATDETSDNSNTAFRMDLTNPLSCYVRIDFKDARKIRLYLSPAAESDFAFGIFVFDVFNPSEGCLRVVPLAIKEGKLCFDYELYSLLKFEKFLEHSFSSLEDMCEDMSRTIFSNSCSDTEKSLFGAEALNTQRKKAMRSLTLKRGIYSILKYPPSEIEAEVREHFQIVSCHLDRNLRAWCEEDPSLKPLCEKIRCFVRL